MPGAAHPPLLGVVHCLRSISCNSHDIDLSLNRLPLCMHFATHPQSFPSLPSIEVEQWITSLRGGSRASRIRASDGRHYILKLHSNPQGNTSLIAEYLATNLLAALQLPVPQLSWARISNPALHAKINPHQAFNPDQTHLAISYPVNPEQQTIHDFLPDPSWLLLANRECFWGALVADKWLANLDCRQAVFVRRRALQSNSVQNLPCSDQAPGLHAILIDQGLCFNGRSLDFKIAPTHGLYSSRIAYQGLSSVAQLQPWIKMAQSLSAACLEALIRTLPADWLEGYLASKALQLSEGLLLRAQQLPRILELTLDCLATPQTLA
jgi:hypothetical protein